MLFNSNNIWAQNLIVSPYCRVSTDKADQVNSLESQIKYFSGLIKSYPNWTLGEIYYDEGITGTSFKKRKNFNRLISDAMLGKVQLIITKEVSRFARNTVDTLVFTRKLKERNVGVYFVLDNIYTLDSDGELRLTIMASLAQEESRKTSERVKWGQQRQMEKGVVFGRDMLGYIIKDGNMAINNEEAPVIREIFKMYLDDKGCHTIARELLEKGFKPKRMKQWTNTTILKILRNEKHVGDLCQKKTYTPNYLTQDKKYNKDKDSMIYLKDHHEPIIARDMWDKVQKELDKRALSEKQKNKHLNRYWCSGKIICGECGSKFLSRIKYLKNEQLHHSWKCLIANREGAKKTDNNGNIIGCDSLQVNDKIFSYCVGEAIKFIQINSKSLTDEILSEIMSVNDSPTIINTDFLKAKINELEARKSKAIDLVIQGLISNDDLRKQIILYDKEIEEITKQIVNSTLHNQIVKKKRDDFDFFLKEIEKILCLGAENTLLFAEVLDHIKAYSDKTLIVFLRGIPFGIKIKYNWKGKLEDYTVIIENVEIVGLE